jgi:aryl-alcohol dehydrogenase-like predicted oxidoreductase
VSQKIAETSATSRRRFLQALAMLGVGGRTLLRSGDARAALDAAREGVRAGSVWPEMSYRTLGRTGWNASRLVFGCGAALSGGRRDSLLDAAFDAGINVFDVGFRGYYRDAETNLAPFLKKHRDRVFLISKAIAARPEPNQQLSLQERRSAAETWTERMDASLRELGVDHVDAYYLMASNNVDLVGGDEIRRAFEQAKQAGKLKHLGLSTHQNAERVLEAAVQTGTYDLAMIAITPAGWYDWADKAILKDSKPMADLQPVLDRARAAGIGLIGMKAGRYLAGRKFLGWGRPAAFDEHYSADFLNSGLSPYQRSYAFVLAHGLDAVNADMQSLEHLQENVAAAVGSSRYFELAEGEPRVGVGVDP